MAALYRPPPVERERFRVEPREPPAKGFRILVFCGDLSDLASDPLAHRRWARWDCAASEEEAEEKIRVFMREGINNPFCD
jgi:hypothetical protein